jgi:hypothetical protein
VIADLENLDDIRVLQPGDRLCFGPEPNQVGLARVRPGRIIFKATTRPSFVCRAL